MNKNRIIYSYLSNPLLHGAGIWVFVLSLFFFHARAAAGNPVLETKGTSLYSSSDDVIFIDSAYIYIGKDSITPAAIGKAHHNTTKDNAVATKTAKAEAPDTKPYHHNTCPSLWLGIAPADKSFFRSLFPEQTIVLQQRTSSKYEAEKQLLHCIKNDFLFLYITIPEWRQMRPPKTKEIGFFNRPPPGLIIDGSEFRQTNSLIV